MRAPLRPTFASFCRALAQGGSYRFWRNRFAATGLVLGCGGALITGAALLSVIPGGVGWDLVLGAPWRDHPMFWAVFLQPPVFMVVFGAIGTINHHKNARIAALVAELEGQLAAITHAHERFKELSVIKTDYLRRFSHQLRSPLVTMKGYLDGLDEGLFGDLDAEQHGALEAVQRNLNRYLLLLDNLLDFSYLDRYLERQHKVRFDLDGAARELALEMQPELNRKRVRYRVQTEGPVRATFDREKFSRVLSNLVQNALNVAPPESEILVRLTRDGEAVVLEVSDDGPGVPHAVIDEVQRRGTAPIPKGSGERGLGLGLVIVGAIAGLYDGAVEIENRSPQGATVRVRFHGAAAPETSSGEAPR